MNIREATKNDCVHMDALLTKLIRYEARFDPNLSPEVVIEDNYAGQIAAEGCKAYVAEDHGIIVGYLYGFTYRIPQVLLQPIAIVDALYVEEGYRGKGIAKDLFRKFQEFASGCGAASIELKVNRSEKVLVCTPLNEDAKAILADMGNGADLKGAKLDVAVNAIVGSLVRNGYLNSISSAIMISVEDKDTARAEKLQRELTSTVDGVLQTSESRASVLTQTLTQDAVLEQQARENSISTGKAALVNRVLALNPALKFDALAKLSVEELKDLAEAGAPAMPIGKDAAAYAAEQYAGTTAVDSVTAEVDPELDESPAHYEVELQTAWGEFEYLVDAYTGKVLSGQKDLLAAVSASNETTKPSGQKPAPSGTVQDIGYAKAKSIALNHAGLSENQAYDMDIELDDEDGTLVYEIEFKSGNMEYDYEIDAASGTILKHEAELDD